MSPTSRNGKNFDNGSLLDIDTRLDDSLCPSKNGSFKEVLEFQLQRNFSIGALQRLPHWKFEKKKLKEVFEGNELLEVLFNVIASSDVDHEKSSAIAEWLLERGLLIPVVTGSSFQV